ncbi:hypothetical protein [Streptomyces sp. NPDC058678]|uniref:hypothetical protein n=1 Tax=Streptomyces sp. NPDC058678 TaxID=3346595 RepID=UPI00364B448C
MEHGYPITTFTDAASDAGPEANDAMVKRYPVFSHATYASKAPPRPYAHMAEQRCPYGM